MLKVCAKERFAAFIVNEAHCVQTCLKNSKRPTSFFFFVEVTMALHYVSQCWVAILWAGLIKSMWWRNATYPTHGKSLEMLKLWCFWFVFLLLFFSFFHFDGRSPVGHFLHVAARQVSSHAVNLVPPEWTWPHFIELGEFWLHGGGGVLSQHAVGLGQWVSTIVQFW